MASQFHNFAVKLTDLLLDGIARFEQRSDRSHQLRTALDQLLELPTIDAVVISHDHYDHLDMATVKALSARGTLFLVPLGVGAHLGKWGIPLSQVRELDWNEHVSLGNVTFTAKPARHFSGRGVTNGNSTLWASWVMTAPRHRVFFCGDSGFFAGFRDIGQEHGPFDLTLISTGAYSSTWPMIHMTPEEVVQAHVDVRGQLLLPIHWGPSTWPSMTGTSPPSGHSSRRQSAVFQSSFPDRDRWSSHRS